jgi:hypothetical protein
MTVLIGILMAIGGGIFAYRGFMSTGEFARNKDQASKGGFFCAGGIAMVVFGLWFMGQ